MTDPSCGLAFGTLGVVIFAMSRAIGSLPRQLRYNVATSPNRIPREGISHAYR
jgi:hypothetical protein